MKYKCNICGEEREGIRAMWKHIKGCKKDAPDPDA